MIKVEYGEGVIEALAEIGIDAEKEVNQALAKDRIQQLALQAGAETWSRPPMRAVTGLAFTDENLEKFAELIVRECFKVVDDFGVTQASNSETYLGESLNVSMKITEAAWKIKEHFGIKE